MELRVAYTTRPNGTSSFKLRRGNKVNRLCHSRDVWTCDKNKEGPTPGEERINKLHVFEDT
jgi:hypothetical protein